jgi:hypothetical protein
MIMIEISKEDLAELEKKLDGVKNPKAALKTAINNTAKEVEKSLSESAAATYRYKGGKSAIKAASDIKKATADRSEATITFKSPVKEIKDYYVSSLAVSITKLTSGGKRSRRTIKGAVLKKATAKALTGATGGAFVVRFKSGHVSVVTRDLDTIASKYNGKRLTKHTQKLRVWRSPAIPIMVKNEKVYGKLEPDIIEEMHEQVQAVIEKVLYG